MGNEQVVEYEGLHSSCFACSEYGHRGLSCPKTAPVPEPEPGRSHTALELGSMPGGDREAAEKTPQKFGPWMIPKKPSWRGVAKDAGPLAEDRKPPAGGTKAQADRQGMKSDPNLPAEVTSSKERSRQECCMVKSTQLSSDNHVVDKAGPSSGSRFELLNQLMRGVAK